MKNTKWILAVACVALFSGCATNPRGGGYVPIVDDKGKDQAQLAADVTECQAFAAKTESEAQKAMAGAVAGALIGAMLAPKGYRNEVAGRGAVMGGLAGAGEGMLTKEAIIKKCLAGRGYSVLN